MIILELIKSNGRLLIVVLAILLLAYAGAITTAYNNEVAKRKDTEIGLKSAIELGNKKGFEITTYKNNQGVLVSKITDLQLSNDNLKALRKSDRLYWMNQFKGLKKDNSNLVSATKIDLDFKQKEIPLKPVAINCDSVKTKTFLWQLKDEYNDISATVIDTPKFYVRLPIYEVITLGRRTKKFPSEKLTLFRYGQREINTEVSTPNKLFEIDTLISIVKKK